MDYNSLFKDKLSKLLFLEIKNIDAFLKKVTKDDVVLESRELFIPLGMDFLADRVKSNNELKEIPISKFIEGMFYAIGADQFFSYNKDYIKILTAIKSSKECIKGIIAEKVKKGNYDDSYVLLRGLCRTIKEEELFEKLLSVGAVIRETSKEFNDIYLEDISNYKEHYPKSPIPYIHEAELVRAEGEFSKALVLLNEYIRLGGKKSEVFNELYTEVSDMSDYEKGKELLEEKPLEALKKLLPLIDKFEDNPLIFYYVGLAYRRLENYEKAIYYLNESLRIDSAIVETVNELGINYAAIGDFDNALLYFRKAFEVTKDIEICTNIVMCYYNIGKTKEAKIHLEIANKLNSEDEVVKQLNKLIGG